MKENEKIIFRLIEQNPYISQQEIADIVGLSRPAVANIISSLVKKKYLLGKAYIVNERNGIVCIGAANVDKKIKTTEKLISYTSNPVTSMASVGGVARNVAENLGRLGNEVSLLSVSGNDAEWARIREVSSPFMNTNSVVTIEGQSTGTYTALLDADGEMYLGLADMSIYDYLTPELLMKQTAILQHASCIIMDLNCPKESIEFICSFSAKNNIKLVLITVSEPKMERLPQNLQAVDCLIVNKGETQAFFNEQYNTKQDLEKAGEKWLSLGVKRVVLTQGSNDLLVMSPNPKWYPIKALNAENIIDVTGAGDSFTAAYIDAWLLDEDDDTCALAGRTNSYHTIQSIQTVRPQLTKNRLLKEMKEY
ncbi:winged helix-turn-helix transcriptional regulator [Carnobacteriaceae bacterium zg-ZUI78]|nr:winged helix-turn-helix transcriptional regulator [Carnobacteriaceae bacterium zg-ZUI78]